MSQFHTQGPVPLESPAYVERAFEQGVLGELLNQQWVLLLGPHKHGKTTGITRIKNHLQEEGFEVITLDLQTLPPCNSYVELLTWIGTHTARGLGIKDINTPIGDTAKDLVGWLEAIVPPNDTPLVIIIDEAAKIPNDEFRNAFYGQIRGISTARGDADANSILRRLRFLFAGTFRPESLVHPDNSPFNVCKRIDTEDLSLEQARELVVKVLGHEEVLADEGIDQQIVTAYNLVGGQPYLLQELFAQTLKADILDREAVFARTVDYIKYHDMHISSLLSRVITDQAVSRIGARLATEGELPMLPGDSDYKHICVLGLAKREGPRLKFRNELYAQIAQSSAQLRPGEAIPDPGALIVALPNEAFDFMKNPQLKEFAISAQRGAVKAFNTGSYRLSLVGFGSSLEALLIDWLTSIPPTELQAAKVKTQGLNFTRYENANDANTWTLVNLMKVSRQVQTPLRAVNPPDPLRDFRNMVHPGKAIKTGLNEEQLKPEAIASSGFFNMVLRDVEAAVTP